METIVTLNTNRSEYDIREAAKCSCTVRELVDELLSNYNEDDKIVFSNDNGYTFGYVGAGYIDAQRVETYEEEEAREKRENMEMLRDELKELNKEYNNDYFNDEDGEQPMTDDEYREERHRLFDQYGITEEEYSSYYGL